MMRPGRRVPASVNRDLERLASLIAASRDELEAVCRAAAPAGTPGVINAVADWLYEHWYLKQGTAPSQDDPSSRQANFAAALRAALPASTRWLQGWTALETRANGVCIAGRRGVSRELRCGDYANLSRPGVPVMPGDGVAVIECVEWVDWQTGFWTARSAAGEPSAPLVRMYWSVAAERIFVVLRRVAGCLDELRVRYSLKCPLRQADFTRVDSLVVYLERAAWDAVRDQLTGIAKELRADLRGSSPPLTRRLTFGAAFAEDPGPVESFGQSRCRALSQAVVAILNEKRRAPDDVGILVEKLRKAGIDPARPWLCAHR
jgi:hypothetical protein